MAIPPFFDLKFAARHSCITRNNLKIYAGRATAVSVLLTYIIDLRVARLPTCGGRGTRTNISKGKAIVYAVVTLSLHEACEAILPVVASGAFRFEQASEEEGAAENQERTGPPAIDSSGLSPALCTPHGRLDVAIGASARAIAAYVIAFVLQDHSVAN